MVPFRYVVIALIVCSMMYFWARACRKTRIRDQMIYEVSRTEKTHPEDNFNTIFVAIPCYRDEYACAETLFSLFNEASCPWRLRVAVMHHVHPAENHYAMNIQNLYEHVVLRHNATSFQSQIKIVVEEISTATGPWDARKAILNLFQNERFVLFVNSNCKFVRNWDSAALDQYTQSLAMSPRPILTTCPSIVNVEDTLESLPTYPVVDSKGELSIAVYLQVPVRPFLTFVFVPTFAFASSRLLSEHPFDLPLSYISNKNGTMLASARLFTYGWDFYTPTVPMCYQTKSSKFKLYNDRPETRNKHDSELIKINGLLNKYQCRICEELIETHDEFSGHTFESWSANNIFGSARTLEHYLKYAERGYLGITSEVSAEEQIAKYDSVKYARL